MTYSISLGSLTERFVIKNATTGSANNQTS